MQKILTVEEHFIKHQNLSKYIFDYFCNAIVVSGRLHTCTINAKFVERHPRRNDFLLLLEALEAIKLRFSNVFGDTPSIFWTHYDDVIMSTIASQITSLTIVYSTVYSGANQSKHQSSASLAFVWGIHRGPVNSPHKWPVTRKMFPFDDVIMNIFVSFWLGIS